MVVGSEKTRERERERERVSERESVREREGARSSGSRRADLRVFSFPWSRKRRNQKRIDRVLGRSRWCFAWGRGF